jgi:hypothetical protein
MLELESADTSYCIFVSRGTHATLSEGYRFDWMR